MVPLFPPLPKEIAHSLSIETVTAVLIGQSAAIGAIFHAEREDRATAQELPLTKRL